MIRRQADDALLARRRRHACRDHRRAQTRRLSQQASLARRADGDKRLFGSDLLHTALNVLQKRRFRQFTPYFPA
jgi:hypothetical protein